MMPTFIRGLFTISPIKEIYFKPRKQDSHLGFVDDFKRSWNELPEGTQEQWEVLANHIIKYIPQILQFQEEITTDLNANSTEGKAFLDACIKSGMRKTVCYLCGCLLLTRGNDNRCPPCRTKPE